MKDSNAAPSSNNNIAPASNASRGKAAAPKARAKAVSNARARARNKSVEPKKSVAPAVTIAPATAPEIEAQAPETEALQSQLVASDVVASDVVASDVVASDVVASDVQTLKADVKPVKTAEQQSVSPEIMFPEVLTPKIVPGKNSVKATPIKDSAGTAATKSVTAPKMAVASATPAAATAPRAGVSSQDGGKSASAAVAPGKRALPKFRSLYIFAALAALILTTAGGVAVGSYNNWSNSSVIAPNVRIAGESIGGMTREQATAHLDKRFAKSAFTLQTDDKNIVLGLADVGGKLSIEPTVNKAFAIGRNGNVVNNFTRVFGSEVKSRGFSLPIEWNRGALTSHLQIANQQYARPAVDARLVTVSGDTPRVTGEENGRALDVSATADAIQKSYFLGLGKVAAVTSAVEPKVTAADLEGRDVKLGFYRTEYNGGIAGRTTNIHVACRAIDGTVLMPGEVLSFNGLTGERTYKKGYRMAHIFLREAGQTESSVVDGLAGGVCQVSSTLYNAVRKTNAQLAGKPLGIVERSSHSLPVTYVPSGRDATVAWPSRDFKFRNDNSFPVYVRTNAGDGRLTITIWGRVPQNQAVPVSLEN